MAGMLLAGALLTAGCSLLPKEAEEPAIDVTAPVVTQREVTAAKRGPIDSTVSVAVSFGAERQQSLYLKTGGRLKKLSVKANQHVEAGQLLVELESGTLPNDVINAELSLKLQQLTLSDLNAKKGFVNEPSALDLQKQEVSVQQAQMNLDQKRESLANTQLYAPFAGTVLTVAVAEADQVDAYKEVAVIAADGPVVARSKVDDSTAAQLSVGQVVKIYPSDGDPTAVTGKIVQAPPAGATSGDKYAIIAPDQASTRVKAGRNGKADVVVQSKADALLVPLSAVRSFGGRQFVTVVKGETRQEVAITTGLSNSQYIEVTQGLQAGDQVVSR
jgi:RND family efflux transporter MFP subunit